MEHSVCFIGHRRINDTPEFRRRLTAVILSLIKSGYANFIFGDRSQFNDVCYEIVTNLKEKYTRIKRIHFRKDYENADDYTMQFLKIGYEQSICPAGVEKAGRFRYIKRNTAMIDESNLCVFYYDENFRHSRKDNRHDVCKSQGKSGTAHAFYYAKSKKRPIINCFEK